MTNDLKVVVTIHSGAGGNSNFMTTFTVNVNYKKGSRRLPLILFNKRSFNNPRRNQDVFRPEHQPRLQIDNAAL